VSLAIRDEIVEYLKNYQPGIRCSNTIDNWGDCWLQGDCASIDLPEKLTFQFGTDATFEIPINNLLQYDSNYHQCVLEIASIGTPSSPSIRMGDPFFKSYYSVYNVTSKQIGLAVSSLAPEGTTISGLTPPAPTPSPDETTTARSIWNVWTEFLIVLLVILVGLIIGLLCYMKHLKSSVNRENEEAAYAEEDYDRRNRKKEAFI